MSMITRVIGIRPPTDDYKKKVAAYLACDAVGVPTPQALLDYFEGVDPKRINPDGMQVDLYEHPAVTPYHGDSRSGLDVDLRGLPEGVTKLRFYNSW